MTKNDLKKWRERLSLTQEEAAIRLGISRSSVSRYETAGNIPDAISLACNRIAPCFAFSAEGYASWKKKLHRNTKPGYGPVVVIEQWEDTDSYDVTVGGEHFKCGIYDFPELIEKLNVVISMQI